MQQALLHGKQAFLPRPTWRSALNRKACAVANVRKVEGKVGATVSKRAEAASATVSAPRAAETNILEGDAVIEKELAENGGRPPDPNLSGATMHAAKVSCAGLHAASRKTSSQVSIYTGWGMWLGHHSHHEPDALLGRVCIPPPSCRA